MKAVLLFNGNKEKLVHSRMVSTFFNVSHFLFFTFRFPRQEIPQRFLESSNTRIASQSHSGSILSSSVGPNSNT